MLLQLFECLLILLPVIYLSDRASFLPVTVSSVTLALSVTAAGVLLSAFSILLLAAFLEPVIFIAASAAFFSLLPLQLLFLILLLSAFFLCIVFCGLLVSIAHEELLWLLEVDDVPAALKVVALVHNEVRPELDRLFLILDGNQNAMLIELLIRIVSLRFEVRNIIIKEGLSNIVIEFLEAKSAQG